MTLILTVATPEYILQVSDRLVTRVGEPFDRASNKNVIYHAKDAIVCIGYSGRAYLDGVPTDQWIAQKLRGVTWLEPSALLLGRAQRWLTIGESMELLRSGCEEVFSLLPPGERSRQSFVVAGWQWRRGRHRAVLRPILCYVANSEDPSAWHRFKIGRIPRYWHWERPARFHFFCVPRDIVPNQVLSDLARRIGEVRMPPAPCRDLLVDTIRSAARTSSVVGPDCMSVLIPRASLGVVDVSYVPSDKPLTLVAEGDESFQLPATYTPWIVGPSLVLAPSISVGDRSVQSGPFTITVRGPEVPAALTVPGTSDIHVLSVLSSQARPRSSDLGGDQTVIPGIRFSRLPLVRGPSKCEVDPPQPGGEESPEETPTEPPPADDL